MTTNAPNADTATVRTTTGETVTITRADVAAAALDAPDYTAYGRNAHWVMVDVGGRLIPVVPLMRGILGGLDARNTNEAEMRLHELGFRVFVTRLFDPAGQPVRLTRDQYKDARP
ncbi:hypothetical protein ACFT0G_06155 [Streptomyces sp. NPDC057020]|uniref:hypothetical protein n=1 Tax=unclassified Streptomyces TaxID=2593676 RepID=UPI00364302BA